MCVWVLPCLLAACGLSSQHPNTCKLHLHMCAWDSIPPRPTGPEGPFMLAGSLASEFNSPLSGRALDPILLHAPSPQGSFLSPHHETPIREGESCGLTPSPLQLSCGIPELPLEPFPFLSRCRCQPLCTVSSRTRYFCPPTRSSQGPCPLPHSPSPHAHPAGSAACLSPQASSSRPGSAQAPRLGPNQL